jgi:glutamate receptor, ionotropic, invertebrate
MDVMMPRNGRPLVGNERFEGFCIDLMQYISDQVSDNVTLDYIFTRVKDGQYGSNDTESKKWNGMVGELVAREADMAVAPLTISVTREDVIDFSQPFMQLGLTVMVYHDPTDQKPSYLAFLTVKFTWGITCIASVYTKE